MQALAEIAPASERSQHGNGSVIDGWKRRRANMSPTAKITRMYCTIGIAMGLVWALNQGAPLWEHAAKLLVLLFVGAPLVHVVLKHRADNEDSSGPQLSVARMAMAKVALLVLAIGASLLLRPVTTHADLFVAGGLTLTIFVFGPKIHPYLFATSPPSNREPAN